MKYFKIKNGEGDFETFEPTVLHEALLEELGPQGDSWFLKTCCHTVHVVVHDKELDTSGVDKVMKDHFKEDWTDYDPEQVAKDELMAKLDAATTIKGLRDILKEELK